MPTKFIEQVTISMHMALEVTSWNNWWRTWWTPPFEWGSDLQPVLGEHLLPPGMGYLLARIMLFPQTLAEVMFIDGCCLLVFGFTSLAVATGLLTV